MTEHYRIAKFAKLGGVTVRTLQYYDRIGLLAPSTITESKHRLYSANDLLRLQQIVTLKWMGFSLKQIKTILSNPTYDLKQTLSAQKTAVDAQIKRLLATSEALQTAIEATATHKLDQLDAETIQAIIRGVTHQGAFMDEYYSETSQAGIALRGMAYHPDEVETFQQQWQQLYADFETNINQPVDHPEVMQLAAKMDKLINLFTGDDQQTENELNHLITDAETENLDLAPHIQTYFAATDNDLRQFMRQALDYYRQSKNRKNNHGNQMD